MEIRRVSNETKKNVARSDSDKEAQKARSLSVYEIVTQHTACAGSVTNKLTEYKKRIVSHQSIQVPANIMKHKHNVSFDEKLIPPVVVAIHKAY